MVVSENKIVFLLSSKKAKFMNAMKVPEGYSGPAVELLEYDPKTTDLSAPISKLVSGSIGKNTGCFKADKDDGNLTKSVLAAISKESELVEMMPLLK
jgi:hypothetical protein